MAHGPKSIWLDAIELSLESGMVMCANAHLCLCDPVGGHQHWDVQLCSSPKALSLPAIAIKVYLVLFRVDGLGTQYRPVCTPACVFALAQGEGEK